MESFEKPKASERIDVQKRAEEYMKGLHERRVNPVDYTKPRPDKNPTEVPTRTPEEQKLWAEAYAIKLREGKTNPKTHQEIYEELRAANKR